MKKLLLILSAVFVSVMGWAASLNPYAYNLSSTWNEATSELTVRFKLNAHPNMKENSSGRGIQIFAIDPSNNKRYYIYGVPGDIIKAKMNEYNGGKGDSYDYELTIPITGKTWDNKDFLPVGKNLTWAVKVAGLNNTDKSTPTAPVYVNQARRPYSCHGVAVNNNQNSPDFGSVYVTEAAKDDELSETWAWLKGKGKALLKYDPRMQDAVSYRKTSAFSNRDVDNCLLEPHRVCVSEDGRVFVSSYNKCKTKDEPVVWEFKNGQFTPVIYYYPGDGIYGDRVCGMAVKGSGADLRIMLCYIDEPNAHPSAFRMYEYDLNNLGTNKNEGNWRGSYAPEGNTTDGSTASVQGAFTKAISNKWYFYSDGLANVSYLGNGHVLAVDFFVGYGANAVLRYYEGTNKKSENAITASNKQGYYYGGAGLLAYQDDDGKYIVSGRTYYYGYESNKNKNETNGRIHTYTLSNTTISSSPKSGWSLTGVKTRNIINAMAMDCAKNIYAVSFTDGSEDVGTGQLLAFAMPYSGETTTIAPSSNAATNRYFNIKPIPNILATDLHYDIVRGKNQYEFSFYVNTKPQEAEIRFYESKAAMKLSLDVVNADNYKDGTNQYKPSFVYKIPQGKLKQGKITVNLGAVGGLVDANGVITNERIPAGVLYWSVYVRTRDNKNAYAPVYQENVTLNFNVDGTQMRKHIVVNNYPETDMFGSIIAANYQNTPTNERGLLIYRINDKGIDDLATPPTNSNVKNERYALSTTSYHNKNTEDNSFLNYPRRMAVAPDGRIYIADEGSTGLPSNVLFHCKSDILNHSNGGVKFWDPSSPNKFTLFSSNKINTSTGVALWKHNPSDDNSWKLYATNTYSEFTTHSDGDATTASKSYYTKANQTVKYGWNGFAEYLISSHPNGFDKWIKSDSIHHSLGMGDASGNFSIVAMDKGIWMCQHREHTVALKDKINQPLADNVEAICISFIPYNSNTRTWRSSWINGSKENAEQVKNRSKFSQTTDAPVQSTPGGGMAYKKIKISEGQYKEYIYVPNHDGHIAQVEITGWTGSGTSIKPTMDTVNVRLIATPNDLKGQHDVTGTSDKWTTSCITSMDFDFAGNLVITIGPGNNNSSHALMVYTMPYDRTNAREIQAPNSCIEIPERVAQLDMDKEDMDAVIAANVQKYPEGCAVDLYRPLQGKMFNTICLPFELDINKLPENHPLNGSRVREFIGVTVQNISGENILVLEFSEVNVLEANKPYIIQPKDDNGYNSIIRFQGPIRLTNTSGTAIPKDYTIDNIKYTITYKGIVPYQEVAALPDPETGEYLRLILVADNRLAAITSTGNMYGFRGYFELSQPLPKGMKARISTDKKTPTNTTIVVDGKKVNIEKYLREGRVYIRVGDSLYTVDGQLVK